MVKGTLSILVWSSSCYTQPALPTWLSRTRRSFPNISLSLVIIMVCCTYKSQFGIVFHCHLRKTCSSSNGIDTQVEEKTASIGYLRETINYYKMSLTFKKCTRKLKQSGWSIFSIPEKIIISLKILLVRNTRFNQ